MIDFKEILDKYEILPRKIKGKDRYVVLHKGKIVDNANGYGYKTFQNALKATFYKTHKEVVYNEENRDADYVKYGLNLHVVYGYFDTIMPVVINVDEPQYSIATLRLKEDESHGNVGMFWEYKLGTNYEIEPDDDYTLRTNWVAYYLEKKIRETKIVNVSPEFATVRVFPWRCCGVIHLKAPVTEEVANNILNTVMSYLSDKFSPSNMQFGQNINYMEVINAVMDSHEMIQYFDAGLGDRKLIDIDNSVDISYFNPTSLMYYVQTENGLDNGSMHMDGNNTPNTNINNAQTANPYYKLLSIAPEYIIQT